MGESNVTAGLMSSCDTFEIDGTIGCDAIVVDAIDELATLAYDTAEETVKLAGFICHELDNE